MRKLLTFVGTLILGSLILASCGGKDSVSLKVDKVKINGDAKDFIEVVPGSYDIKKSKGTFGEELSVSIKLKVTQPYDPTKVDENTGIGNMSLQITDGSGNPIALDFSPAGMPDWDKINGLVKGKAGDEVTVTFKSGGLGDPKDAIADIMKNGKGIEISRADVTNPKTAPIIDNSPSSSSDVEGGAGDCEQFVSDYESFADEYVEFMQNYKSNPSDPQMIADYADMVKKSSEMAASIKDCKADASVASRVLKAQAKIAKALAK